MITEALDVPEYLSTPGGWGASSAEIAALLVFPADPTPQVVEVSSCERYGADVGPPDGPWSIGLARILKKGL